MKCPHCDGPLIHGRGHYEIIRAGYRLTLTDIPLWTCSRCGRSLLSDWQIQALERLNDRVAVTLLDLRREHRA
jgi:YgiT-type zinc finger domain-containing protein